MTRPPLVSVLTPAFNSERWLGEAIESALAQTHPHVEVIVVDDGSTDGTLSVARRYEGDRVQVIPQENAGACVARNRALAEARGEFVKFLDADDVLPPDAIEVQLQQLPAQTDGQRAVSFGDLVTTDEHLTPVPDDHRPPPQLASPVLAERIAALLSHNIQTSLPLHRRDWLVEIGGFRPHLKRAQEYDLHLRLALEGTRFVHVARDVVYVRDHSSPDRITNTSPLLSDPSAHLAIQIERRQMLEAHLGAPLPPPVARGLAVGMWRHTRRLVQAGQLVKARQYAEEGLLVDPTVRHSGRAFQTLSRALGPVRAERVLIEVRRLRGRARFA